MRIAAVGITLILLSALMASVHGQNRDSKRVAAEDAVKILRAINDQIRGYQWRFRFERLHAANPDAATPDEFRFATTVVHFGEGQAYYDVLRGHYLVEMQSVSPWAGGAASHIAIREAASFDGASYRNWERSRHGTELPPFEVKSDAALSPEVGPLVGTIATTEERNPPWIHSHFVAIGLCFLPPFAHTIDEGELTDFIAPLADDLQRRIDRGEDVRVDEQSNGEWAIEMRHHAADGLMRLRIDPTRGGLVTAGEWLNAQPPRRWQRFFVTKLHELEHGVWAPAEILMVNTIDGLSYRYQLDDVTLNPDITDEKFRARFPTGTLVDDHINRLSYAVGGGAEKEAEAVRSYLERHDIAKLPPPEALAATKWQKWHITLIVVNVVVLISVLVYIGLRRRHQRPV